jgi:hypothetical protein
MNDNLHAFLQLFRKIIIESVVRAVRITVESIYKYWSNVYQEGSLEL